MDMTDSVRLRTEVLPEHEQQAAQLIDLNLGALRSYAGKFQKALRLFDFCERQQQTPLARSNIDMRSDLSSWQFVACRDGAMTLFHFNRSFEAVYENLNRAPTLEALIARAHITEGVRSFHKRFPFAVKLRHGVAHAGELATSPEAYENNAFTGSIELPAASIKDVERFMARELLGDRVFSTTINQKIVSYEISAKSLDQLRFTYRKFLEAFRPAEAALLRLP